MTGSGTDPTMAALDAEHEREHSVYDYGEVRDVTLTEFLTARLDEDEAVTRAAVIAAHVGTYKPHPELAEWRYEPDGEVVYVYDDDDTYYVTCDSEGLSPAVDERRGPHIARHDPARVLADVAAHRRIVALHDDSDGGHECPDIEPGPSGDRYTAYPMICLTLRLLALPHDSHPDYDPSWKPTEGATP